MHDSQNIARDSQAVSRGHCTIGEGQTASRDKRKPKLQAERNKSQTKAKAAGREERNPRANREQQKSGKPWSKTNTQSKVRRRPETKKARGRECQRARVSEGESVRSQRVRVLESQGGQRARSPRPAGTETRPPGQRKG